MVVRYSHRSYCAMGSYSKGVKSFGWPFRYGGKEDLSEEQV